MNLEERVHALAELVALTESRCCELEHFRITESLGLAVVEVITVLRDELDGAMSMCGTTPWHRHRRLRAGYPELGIHIDETRHCLLVCKSPRFGILPSFEGRLGPR